MVARRRRREVLLVYRRSVLKASMLMGMAVVGAWCAPASTAHGTPKCAVLTGGMTYPTLQEAIDAASEGATVRVQGTCEGDVTISKDLRIVGRRGPHLGPPTLNGGNSAEHPGHVVVDRGAAIEITGLTITGGYATKREPGESGGGIYNKGGSITLTDSSVSGNVTVPVEAPEQQGPVLGGGGIYNEGGSVTLDKSTVTDNIGAGKGGGIDNEQGTLTLTASTVSDNVVSEGERGISGNPRDGGGIYNAGGSVTLTNSTVSGNKTPAAVPEGCPNGGGIDNEDGSVTLTRSTVSANYAGCAGGGISNFSLAGSVTLSYSTVSGNAVLAHECGTVGVIGGGGIYNRHALTLNGSSSVTENTSETHGGGIYNVESEGATITLASQWTGTISSNEPDDIFNGEATPSFSGPPC